MRKTIISLLAFVTVAGVMLACGSEPTPTPGPPRPTPTPLPVRAPGWEGTTLRTICLEVEQSYPGIEGKDPEPIPDAAQDMLSGLGIQVMSEPGPCDATLSIGLACRALSSEYVNAGECFSGSEAEGEMALTAPGRTPLTQPISGRYPTPYEIIGCPGVADAPFEYAWTEALLRGVATVWGPQVLVRALEEGTPWEREVAAEALGDFGPEEGVVPALAGALEGGGGDVRRAAAEALLEIGPGAVEAVPALIGALEDRNLTVRRDAAETLGKIGPEASDAVPALIQALEDDFAAVRSAAAQALGRLGPEAMEAVPALIQALQDQDEDVRRKASFALRFLTDQDLGQDPAAWQEWWEGQQ